MGHTVAIVGRPNVGKSALFNALAGRDISLVFDRPGTTRDRLVTTAKWRDHKLTLKELIVGRKASPPRKPSRPPLASTDEIVYSVASSMGSIQ